VSAIAGVVELPGCAAGISLHVMGMPIVGSCHCKNISFVLDWSPEPTEIPARACSCSFCMRHGGVWTACPTGSLKIAIKEPERTSKYSFDTKTADFHICSICGLVPIVTSRIDGRLFAVVNVNLFDGVDPALLRRAPAHLEGEDESTRLARRKRNWIGDVEFVSTLDAEAATQP